MLSPAEQKRYRPHLILPSFGPSAQEALKRSRLLCIGAGGLGCPSLLYLAAAGVGHITLLDSDNVEESNLQRQVLYKTSDIGQPKALLAAQRLREINPLIEVTALAERFTHANARRLLRDADLLIDGSDNFLTRYLVNDACILENKPFVYGALHRFDGQVSVFNHKGGPSYRCLYPEQPDDDSPPYSEPAGVLGVMPGLIGTLQACEAIKVLTGVGEPLSGRLLVMEALGMSVRFLKIPASPTRHQVDASPFAP